MRSLNSRQTSAVCTTNSNWYTGPNQHHDASISCNSIMKTVIRSTRVYLVTIASFSTCTIFLSHFILSVTFYSIRIYWKVYLLFTRIINFTDNLYSKQTHDITFSPEIKKFNNGDIYFSSIFQYSCVIRKLLSNTAVNSTTIRDSFASSYHLQINVFNNFRNDISSRNLSKIFVLLVSLISLQYTTLKHYTTLLLIKQRRVFLYSWCPVWPKSYKPVSKKLKP